jgi:hypothetical protein
LLAQKGIEIDSQVHRKANIMCACGTVFVPSNRKGRGGFSLRCKRCQTPTCVICGAPATPSSARHALCEGTRAYCAEHRGGRKDASAKEQIAADAVRSVDDT